MKGNTEELYHGYILNTYISVGLIASGVLCIALAIAFTLLAYSIWVLVLCWALGVILLILFCFLEHYYATLIRLPGSHSNKAL
jgi:hypothetical protein